VKAEYIIKKVGVECVVRSRRLPNAIVYGVLLKWIDVAGLPPSEVGILSRWRKKLSTAGDFVGFRYRVVYYLKV